MTHHVRRRDQLGKLAMYDYHQLRIATILLRYVECTEFGEERRLFGLQNEYLLAPMQDGLPRIVPNGMSCVIANEKQ